MAKPSRKIGVLDIVILVISILFFVGILTVFQSCDPMEDGTWMTCHWAEVMVAGLAGVQIVLAILQLIFADPKVKTGLSIAMIPVAVLSAITPGTLIHLCMMNTMRCHAVMRPADIVFSIILIVLAVINVLRQKKTKTGVMV